MVVECLPGVGSASDTHSEATRRAARSKAGVAILIDGINQ